MNQHFVEVPRKIADLLLELDRQQEQIGQRIDDIVATARLMLGLSDGARLVANDDGTVGFLIEVMEVDEEGAEDGKSTVGDDTVG